MVTFFRLNWLLMLLLTNFVSASAQVSPAETILLSEQSRFDAMMGHDSVVLTRLLADDLIYIHSNGLKENKKEHIAAIQTGKIIYQSMNRENPAVRIYGKTALVSGKISVKGIISGNPFDIKLLYTAVYHKKRSVWQLVNWQSTRYSP